VKPMKEDLALPVTCADMRFRGRSGI